MKYTKDVFFTDEISAAPPDGGKVFYLCIGKVCKGRGCPNIDCYHTGNIKHAKNKSFPNANSIFRRAIDGSWWEDETMENKPEIIINSEGDGKYLLIIGDKQWRGKTLDECMAIINGKALEQDDRR